jgi:hypothetical protein
MVLEGARRYKRFADSFCAVHARFTALVVPCLEPIGRCRCQVVAVVVTEDLDDRDGAEGGPQPAEGRKLVIVNLGPVTTMPS